MAGTAEEVEVAGRKVRLTSVDRVIFPKRGFTKGDVFRYYVAVGDGIMRALGERPTTLQRFPDGIDGEMFFQKRVPTRGVPPWVQTARITFPSGRPADELCPADLAHVAWAAQMGTVVFHPWPVRRSSVDSPDELRIDLDPQPGTDFVDVVGAAGVASTCTCGSVHSGVSWRCAGRGSRWRARRSGAGPSSSPRAGGRRSGGSGCSSTTTRWPGTAPSRARTPCAPTSGPRCPRR